MGLRQCDAMVTAGEIRPLALTHGRYNTRLGSQGKDGWLQGKINSEITGMTGRTRMPAVAALCWPPRSSSQIHYTQISKRKTEGKKKSRNTVTASVIISLLKHWSFSWMLYSSSTVMVADSAVAYLIWSRSYRTHKPLDYYISQSSVEINRIYLEGMLGSPSPIHRSKQPREHLQAATPPSNRVELRLCLLSG